LLRGDSTRQVRVVEDAMVNGNRCHDELRRRGNRFLKSFLVTNWANEMEENLQNVCVKERNQMKKMLQ
jgi:hypothetical protein